MLAEDDKNELACKDLHHVREQHIKDEKARFKVRLPLSILLTAFLFARSRIWCTDCKCDVACLVNVRRSGTSSVTGSCRASRTTSTNYSSRTTRPGEQIYTLV